MYTSEINSLLEEAFRKNSIKLGARILENLKNKKGKLLILTNDMSIKQLELYKTEAKKNNTPYIVLGTSNDLCNAIGRVHHNAAIIVKNKYANKLKSFFEEVYG